jgi:hypothetical protein
MSSDYDATEFVDSDFQAAKKSPYSSSPAPAPGPARAPTREEVDNRVSEAQQRLTELKRVQEELERERAGLEETRRRQIEYQTGRQEVIQNLTRGLGLLGEAEFGARRDAEQMAKAIADMREALAKVEATREETWTQDNFTVELTRGLTAIENARMEWNSARLKFTVLSGGSTAAAGQPVQEAPAQAIFGGQSLWRTGLMLTWPLAVVALLALAVFVAVLVHR